MMQARLAVRLYYMATAYYCNALKNGFNAAGGEVGQGLHCALCIGCNDRAVGQGFSDFL